MIRNLLKGAKARRVMQEITSEGMEILCKRVEEKTANLTRKLQNGGGDAIISLLKKP